MKERCKPFAQRPEDDAGSRHGKPGRLGCLPQELVGEVLTTVTHPSGVTPAPLLFFCDLYFPVVNVLEKFTTYKCEVGRRPTSHLYSHLPDRVAKGTQRAP